MGKVRTVLWLCLVPMFLCAPARSEEFEIWGAPQPAETAPIMAEPEGWLYPISLEILRDDPGVLSLVNRDNRLTREDVPEDLVNIQVRKKSYDPIQLRQVASDALDVMFEDAEIQEVTLYVQSGYRDYRTQEVMHYNRLERDGGVDDLSISPAGASEHQTGLGVDVVNRAILDGTTRMNYRFFETKEGSWIAEHCWEYGFIVRYPQEKTEITQVIYEPWHLRYVGVDVAAFLTHNNLTLEEFTAEWQAEVTALTGETFDTVLPEALGGLE